MRIAVGGVETGNNLAPGVSARIAAGGHDDAERGTCIPGRLTLAEVALERRQADVHEIGLEASHDRLCLRVAKAAVELDHFGRAVRHDHETRVQEAEVGIAVGTHAIERRPDDLVHDARLDFGRDDRGRRIGTHAARVWPDVAFVARLVVL